jgi:hypothetical protein
LLGGTNHPEVTYNVFKQVTKVKGEKVVKNDMLALGALYRVFLE